MMTSFFSPKLKEKLRPIIGTTPLESRARPRFFHFFCVALRRSPAVVSTQGVVAHKKTTTRYGGASRPSGPGTCRRGRGTTSGKARRTRGTPPAPRLRWRRCAPATAWCWRTRASHGLPFRLEGRDVDDDAAARVGRLAKADGEHVSRDAEVLHGTGQRKRVRRDDAHIAPVVDEVSLVERLGIDDGRVDIGEDLELGRAADVVAVAGSAVGHHAAPADL